MSAKFKVVRACPLLPDVQVGDVGEVVERRGSMIRILIDNTFGTGPVWFFSDEVELVK